jgi:hypothetical protein
MRNGGKLVVQTARCVVVMFAVALMSNVAMADEHRNGFFDLYGGLTGLLESDVPGWTFEDLTPTVGARAGIRVNNTWGVAVRTWYFQADVKERDSSPSDLAVLGISLELLGRWQLDRRWAIYSSLGPAMGVATLDFARANRRSADDARSLAPGVSAAVGIEVHLVGRVSAFSEAHGSLFYPSFHFADQTISPRLLSFSGVLGVRIGF